MSRRMALLVAAVVMGLLIGGLGGQAQALTCTDVGGVDVAGDCTLAVAFNSPVDFTLTIPGDLVMAPGGSLNCNDPVVPAGASACNITVTVGGNMEMQAGSAIRAENTVNGGSGGNIALTVAGNFTMRGPSPANPGAVISSRKTAGAGDTGQGGDIRVVVGNVTVNPDDITITCATTPAGNIVMETGSLITADANGGAGAIKLFAGENATINGIVRSHGFTTLGRGGPIIIDACCDLIVGDTGQVSSRGQDPGADLVHLQGCVVTIFGLVESTGPGHFVPPNNLCNAPIRPGKPANSTGCVEIWSGTTILIDATGTHNGEVNADVGLAGGTQGTGWIDILAHNAITITGDPTPPTPGTNNDTVPAYAVHANMPLQNGHGGVITVISTDTTVTTSGRAIQANSSTASNGGQGGQVTVLASSTIAFGTAFIQAAGDTTGGGGQAGGTIFAHSFNAKVTGAAPGQLNATGPGGTVTLQGCGQVAADYTGTVIGLRTDDPTCTGGTPPLPIPANTLLPAGDCLDRCDGQRGNKFGRKFNDLNKNGVRDLGEPGLPGWEIRVFNTATLALVDSTTTGADGSYTFNLAPGSYTVCEVLQLGWTQSAPCLAGGPPATCTGTPIPAGETLANCTPFGADLGPRGYSFTMVGAETLVNNDFGNFTECPKFPGLAADRTFTLDSNNPTQIQDIVDDPANANKVILLLPHLGKKTENVVISQKLQLFACSITLTAEDPSQPVVRITTGANAGLTKDLHATGSTVAGYKIESTGHTIQNTRAFGNAIGFWITGNSNLINGALGTTGNGTGFKIDGNSNTLDTNNGVELNSGDGILITGDFNTVKKYTVRSNGGNGIKVEATANGTNLTEDKAYTNALNGYQVLGTNTKLTKNIASDNTGCEFNVVAGNTNGKDNKANNVTVLPNVVGPFPTGCIDP